MILALLAGCGESKDYYETYCPIKEGNRFIGYINTLEPVDRYAYWGCKGSICTHELSKFIEITQMTNSDFKVCCGTTENRVDVVRLTLNVGEEYED